MGLEFKCNHEGCPRNIVSCFSVLESSTKHEGQYDFVYNCFSCIAHQKEIIEKPSKYYPAPKYILAISDFKIG